MIRLGRISYVNMAPVFHRLAADVEEVTGVPTDLNARLLAGGIDLAPISSIEYARNAARLRILPRLCVSSEGAVDSAGPGVTPVGQLWLLNMSLVIDGRPARRDQLQATGVEYGKDPLWLYWLGVRKDGQGPAELVVYAGGAEPLLRAPLRGASCRQDLPLTLERNGDENDPGLITLSVLGKYRAALTVGALGR